MEENKEKLLTNTISINFEGYLNGNSLHTKVELILKEPLEFGGKEYAKNMSAMYKLFNNHLVVDKK